MMKIALHCCVSVICILALSPPTPPELTVTYTGDVMKATCVIGEGDPAPSLTWFLGEEEVQQDPEDALPASEDDPWEWPAMIKATSKTLTRRLRAEDSGKVLKCSVTHAALTQPLEASEVVKGKAKVAKAKDGKETTGKDAKPTDKKKETKHKDAKSTDKKKKTKGKDAKSKQKKKQAKGKDHKSEEIKRIVVNQTPKIKMSISRDEL